MQVIKQRAEPTSFSDSRRTKGRTSARLNWLFFENSRRTGLPQNPRRFTRKLRLAIYRRSNMKKKLSRLSEAILEMAGDQYRTGIMDKATHEKITVRLLGPQVPGTAKPISGEVIRSLRESANLSQAAFARYLNLTTGYISQLERGAKQPKGPALALLNVIRRKGFEAIL